MAATRARFAKLLPGAFGTRTWVGFGYLFAGVVSTALGWLAVVVTVVTGVLLGVTVIGIRVVPVLTPLVRAASNVERWRCGIVLPARPPEPSRMDRIDRIEGAARSRDQARIALRDPGLWRDLAWLVVAFPLNLAGAVLAASGSATGLGLATLPVWYRFLPGGRATFYDSGGVAHGVVDSVPAALPWALAGLALIWTSCWLVRGLAVGIATAGAALLRASPNEGLRKRVAALSATRTAAVAEQQRELHRIERDLHDGAQARLVALSADLGLADETFDDDPERAHDLIEHARDGILVALAELRDLVRGIGPPVLRDRGLAAALEALTARSPVPVRLAVELRRRPPATVEAAAYFVVCEGLANAAKHSRATRVEVTVREQDGQKGAGKSGCLVVVRDDGVGGARPDGPGLAGLADRVAALDGHLTIDSPAGGPTTLEAVLPCG